MVGKIFKNSRFLVLVTVLVCAVAVGAMLETLYFGLVVAVVIFSGVYATVSMKEHKADK